MAEPTKFVIAGTQRTGTTLLRTSLSSHPDIACHGEVFKLGKTPYALPGGYWAYTRLDSSHRIKATLLPQRSLRDFLAQLYAQRDKRAVGFKLMLNQCEPRPYLWPLVMQHRVKVILVTRSNVLKTLVSRQTAATSGVYHVSASLPAKAAVANWVARPIVIDAKTIVQDLDTIAQEAVEWKNRLGQLEFIELNYETYVQDHLNLNVKVLDFLGVPTRVLDSDLKKVNPDQLSSLVANYNEIAEVVRRSPYSSCLDTDD